MNKTVTFNISGMVFYIEEQAYEKLKSYLQTIRGYFSGTDGGNDIVEDIESRIAELFSEKINASKQALLMSDVDAIIEIMGRPESFADENNSQDSSNQTNQSTHNQTAEPDQSQNRKRIFRDPDEKIIGGVCSGISHYFAIDPIWLRLIFAVSFFGFGAGLWVYIILWVIIPKAKTTADKLVMKGEPINIANIEKNIKEELEAVKNNVNNLASDLKNGKRDKPFTDFINRLVNLISIILKGLISILAKIIGGFAIFIGVLLLIVFSALFFGSDNVIQFIQFDEIESFSFNEVLEIIFASSAQLNTAKIGIALMLGAVVVALVFAGIRVFFRLQESRRLIKALTITMWSVGLIMCVIVGIKISSQFSSMQRSRSKATLSPAKSKVLYLSMNAMLSDKEGNHTVINKDNRTLLDISENQLILGYPKIDIVKSETDSFEIEIVRSSRGSSKKDAFNKAENVGYEYLLKDSNILFNPYFITPLSDKYRGQELKAIIKVPVGKIVYLSNELEGYIYDVDNITNTYDVEMVGRRWMMSQDGLTCIDCEGIKDRFKKGKSKKQIRITKRNGDKVIVEEEINYDEDLAQEEGI
jgi:phage shock protein PspC (stress-responsive transcriptional regulator)